MRHTGLVSSIRHLRQPVGVASASHRARLRGSPVSRFPHAASPRRSLVNGSCLLSGIVASPGRPTQSFIRGLKVKPVLPTHRASTSFSNGSKTHYVALCADPGVLICNEAKKASFVWSDTRSKVGESCAVSLIATERIKCRQSPAWLSRVPLEESRLRD